MQKSIERFIRDYVADQPVRVQEAVAAYEKDAAADGARICNDGFPDTRFKGTYPEEHLKARKFIARIRDFYEQTRGRTQRGCAAWRK